MAPKRRKLGEAFSFTALSDEPEVADRPGHREVVHHQSPDPAPSQPAAAAEQEGLEERSRDTTPTRLTPAKTSRRKTSSSSPSDAPSVSPSNGTSSGPSNGSSRAGVNVSVDPAGTVSTTSPTPAARTRRSTRPPAARRGRDGAAQAARNGATNIPIARILYLPEDLIEPIRVYRATNGITNTQLALRALNATHRQIPDLIAAEHQPQVVSGDLFDEVVAAPSKSNRQVEITPTAAQLDTIDPLVQSTGANDRSHLFAIAIRQFLTDAGLLQS